MKKLLAWLDERTGLGTACGDWLRRPVPGGPAWRFVWPTTIAFAFLVEAITGLVLWMYYSPGAQSAWESVYYLQYHVQGGWLLRAIHYYTAQAMLVLTAIYVVQMVVRRACRAPRELLFWTAVFLGLVTLGLNLTGDLFAWDQNGFWCTRVRTGFLLLLPGIGENLFRVAVGGPGFGHLTLTRFLALHVGVFSSAFLLLLVLHAWLARRHGLEGRRPSDPAYPGQAGTLATRAVTYWPRQAARDAVACAIVLAVVLLLLFVPHVVSGVDAGVELGAPANPAEAYAAARPEWSFRGLFEFAHLFPAHLEILPIFVIPGALVLLVLAMPFLANWQVGHWFNVGVIAVLLVGIVFLSWRSLARDAANEEHQTALAAGREQAERARELADAQGVPVSGALSLLRSDPKTEGPRLFRQYCACCHDHGEGGEAICGPEPPTAPNLGQFAARDWIKGILDPKQIAGPNYFGNTKFKKGQMVGFVKETLREFDAPDIEKAAMALSAEAALYYQRELDARDAAQIREGKELLTETLGCTDCHKLYGKGGIKGPDLTGYGSRQWLTDIIANPAHKRFYGTRNDRMPAYAESSDPAQNTLSDRDLALLVEWLRGEWYEAAED